MQELTSLTIDEFLDRTADRSPTPGGGGVTALAGALACALARMAIAYSMKSDKETSPSDSPPDVALAKLLRIDHLLRALVTQDAQAYAQMTAAAKQVKDDPAAKDAYSQAVMAAVAMPMEMAALVSQALTVMDEFKASANPYLLSDLGAAAALADATAQAARYTVQINVGELSDAAVRSRILADIDRVVAHSADRRASIETFVRRRLEGDAPTGR